MVGRLVTGVTRGASAALRSPFSARRSAGVPGRRFFLASALARCGAAPSTLPGAPATTRSFGGCFAVGTHTTPVGSPAWRRAFHATPAAAHVFRSPFPDVALSEQPLHEFLFERSRHTDEAVAFKDYFTGVELTWGEFKEQVGRVAAGLQEAGVGRGDVVCAFLPNDLAYPVLLTACSRAGAVLTTSNPTYTAEEVAFQLGDAGVSHVVTVGALLPVVDEAIGLAAGRVAAVRNLWVVGATSDAEAAATAATSAASSSSPYSNLPQPPRAWASLLASAGEAAPVAVGAQDVVLLPYSSGTTGRPKGVELTHHNVVNNTLQMMPVDDISPKDTFVGILPFFHIYGTICHLMLAASQGARVVFHPRFELEKFLQCLQDDRVTYVHVAPPVAIALAKHPLVDQFDLSHVRMVFSAAAPCGPALEAAVSARLNGVTMKQAWGMSELSPVGTYVPFAQCKAGSVGQLVPNTTAKILAVAGEDESGGEPGDAAAPRAELGPNEVGELLIRGPQVMKGYLNRPDATAATIDADGYLHSGDVAWFDDHGNVFIADRVKELIKYKGFQVPPAELEELLLRHPAVVDCTVVGKPDERVGEIPVAFVVAKAEAPHDEAAKEDIMAFVAQHVAPYKRVRQVQFTDAIAKSPSGKILRRLMRSQIE